MTDPRRYVRQGQPLALAAEQVNWLNQQMRGNPGFGGGSVDFPQAPYVALPGRNLSNGTVPRWGALEIVAIDGGTPGEPDTQATQQFERTPVLRLAAPTAGSGTKRFAVALEPVQEDKIGWFAVDGVVQAKVRLVNAADQFVRLRNGSYFLESGSHGDGVMLWNEGSLGDDRWALIRIAAPGPAAVMLRFSGSWSMETYKTVTVLDSTDSISVLNRFADISAACGERIGAAIKHGAVWYLVAAQFG